MFKKILKLHHLSLIILIAIVVPAFSFLLKPGIYWNMHDDMQLIRQLEMEKCLNDGQIPCRWTPDVGYGYGLPLFNYYPPLPYFVGQIFRASGFSFVTSVKLTAILQIVLSAYFMYLLGSSLFGPLGGLLSGLFYTYAPYHALNIYVRGAMNEAWASVFFPLLFLFSKKLIETQKLHYLLLLSISLTMLLLSHNPMVLIFSPLLLIWSIYWIYNLKPKKLSKIYPILTKLSIAVLFSVGLSAFFTIPVLLESKLVRMDMMFTDYYSYFNHFVSLYQLFISNFWGDGGSIWGPNDNMSFSVGYFHWIFPTIIFLILFVKYLKKCKLSTLEFAVIGLVLLAYTTAFMAHERSTFIWKIFSPIQKIQFPWRFLNLTNFFFSLSVGLLPTLIIKNNKSVYKKYLPILALIILLIVINIKHFTPVTYGPVTDSQKFSGLAWTNQISGGINDYLPATATLPPLSPAKDFVDTIYPDNVGYSLIGQKKGSDWQFFNIKIDRSARITLSQLAFPNFIVLVNNNYFTYQTDQFGRITLNLEAGEHQIYLKLRNTPVRSISNYISLFSWLIMIPLLGKPLWKKLT